MAYAAAAMDHETCMFCGKERMAVRYLISTPRARMCDECVAGCCALSRDGRSIGVATPFQPCGTNTPDIGEGSGGERDTSHCSFCSRPQAEVAVLVLGYHRQICDECLARCRDIAEEALSETTT
jgi:ATP-dependent protease Clp ATPase subunit